MLQDIVSEPLIAPDSSVTFRGIRGEKEGGFRSQYRQARGDVSWQASLHGDRLLHFIVCTGSPDLQKWPTGTISDARRRQRRRLSLAAKRQECY